LWEFFQFVRSRTFACKKAYKQAYTGADEKVYEQALKDIFSEGARRPLFVIWLTCYPVRANNRQARLTGDSSNLPRSRAHSRGVNDFSD
jgi:hypothetical protein